MNGQLIALILTALLSSVIGPVVVELSKIWMEKIFGKKKTEKHESDRLKESLIADISIIDKIEEIKNDYDVSRVWICQFHNGGYFYPTGKSMQKLSMTYELTLDEFPKCMQQFQNIPASLFSKTITKLYDGQPVISDINNPDGYGITSIISNDRISSSFLFPIVSIDGKFVGILGLDYRYSKKLSQEQISHIEIIAASVAGVLMNYLETK